MAINGYLETFTDSTRQLTLAQITTLYQQHRFSRLPGNHPLKNYTTATHWLHIRLAPANLPLRSAGLVYQEIDNPRINQVNFYQLVGSKLVNQVTTGDSLPFYSRQFPHYNWVFPVLPDASQPTDVFVMLAKQSETLNARVKLWGPNAFERYDRTRFLLWGILAGLTVLVLLINSMVWLATADSLFSTLWRVPSVGWIPVQKCRFFGLPLN